MRAFLVSLLGLWSNLVVLAAGELAPAATRPVDFVRDIQPLLQKHCWKCHSAEKQEGGLRLDTRRAVLEGGDSGAGLVAGKSADSRLVQLVAGLDEDRVMPPEGDRLTAAEIGLLRAWIDQGAAWPADAEAGPVRDNHWSYQPLIRPAVPETGAVGSHPVDAFVLDRLKERDWTQSPEADRYTLVRRIFLDLTGLPPTPEEVDAFVRDDQPQAYERLVDRLLMSPHFGERWGRHWLDMARFADSDGYEKDRPRPDAWRWRDWVIKTINDDMPFDQFTVEQLAGDLLPEATPLQKLATAFHRQTLTNTEGGTDQEQFRVEACFDRVETTGAVWLGLTVGCARCHSHKYDRISQRDYYRLFAFVNNGDETNTDVPISPDAVAKYERDRAAWQTKLSELEQKLDQSRSGLKEELAQWEAGWQQRRATESSAEIRYVPLTFDTLQSTSGAKLTRQDDGSYLVTGPLKDGDEYTLTVRLSSSEAITGLRIETIPDASLPGGGAGRAKNGNFVLSDLRLYAGAMEKLTTNDRLAVGSAQADFHQTQFPPQNAIDGDSVKTGWAVSPQLQQPHQADFLLETPLSVDGDRWLQVVLDQRYGQQHMLGRFRISLRHGSRPADGIPEAVLAVLETPAGERSAEQQTKLLEWFAGRNPVTKPLIEQIAQHRKQEPAAPVMNVRVIAQRANQPRTTYVLKRGEFLDPIKELAIAPGGLSVLPELKLRDPERPDRLDFARWLVSPDNPLTPRVTVNHIWKHLFGEGLVRTVNDFGVRGDKPTHPELLDWLATEFMAKPAALSDTDSPALKEQAQNPWSRKRLIRLIVTSRTYRQSSALRPELLEQDPQNLLLARQNRLRVEGEIVRDLSLAVSGLLHRQIGGPSVFPPLPPGVAELSYAGNFSWKPSTGTDRYRRGMYTFFKRTAPHPNLTSFDCPDANTTCVKRQISNTPLQALTLLNNETFLEAAQAFGNRMRAMEAASDTERLEAGFRLCVARPMTGTEATQFAELLDAARGWYADHQDEAKQLAGTYPVETAAWVATSRVMLNLDEFVTRN